MDEKERKCDQEGIKEEPPNDASKANDKTTNDYQHRYIYVYFVNIIIYFSFL